MYPISRPASNMSNHVAPPSSMSASVNANYPSQSMANDLIAGVSQNSSMAPCNGASNNPYAFQMNAGQGGTFPRNKPQRLNPQQHQHQQYDAYGDAGNLDANPVYDQKLRNNPITPNIQQIRQKRVQFANIPPSPANPVAPG